MSAWLARFEVSGPALDTVPNVPKVSKLPTRPTFGTFDTIGTRVGDAVAAPTTIVHAATFGTIGTFGTDAGSHGDGLSEWATKLLAMPADDEPCPGIRRWHAAHRAARQFLQAYEAKALDLGWTTLDLFSVHRRVGTIRGDCTGALMLGGSLVVAITADLVRYSDGLAYRRHPMSPVECIPVWEFGR